MRPARTHPTYKGDPATATQAQPHSFAISVAKKTVLREAGVATVHLFVSGRTRGLIGAPEFGLMKPNARFVNTSRGTIVDEGALIEPLAGIKRRGPVLFSQSTRLSLAQ